MFRRLTVSALVPVALLLSGCSATGMGSIVPIVDSTALDATTKAKATFGFSFDATTSTFSGSYHDPNGRIAVGIVDVALKGTGVLRPCKASEPACVKAPANTKGGCAVGPAVPYESQNPKIPGSGTFFLLVCDADGNGLADDGDTIFIQVDTGPYMGYTNSGNAQGNITVRS